MLLGVAPRESPKTIYVALVFACVTMVTASAQTFTTLVVLTSYTGTAPEMSFIQGVDANFYGTTSKGGLGNGNAIRVTPTGVLTVLHMFDLTTEGAPPSGLALGTDPRIFGTDGAFFGTAYAGGIGGPYGGGGTVFAMTFSGTAKTLYDFCLPYAFCVDGVHPAAPLILGPDGSFYGTTEYGGNYVCRVNPGGCGTIFSITPEGELTSIHRFQNTDGAGPIGPLIQATDGYFYGTTGPSSYDQGRVFKMSPAGKLITLHAFCTHPYCTDGFHPVAGVVQASDGNLYGTTVDGGENDNGTVFKITLEGQYTILHSFNFSVDGAYPFGPLIQATDGKLYGTTSDGPSTFCTDGCGTVFQITTAGTLTTLHTFCAEDGCSDGNNPRAGLLQATNGILYGTTTEGGGLQNDGTIFSLDMGLGPFVAFVRGAARQGQRFGILGNDLRGTNSVSLNGVPADFTVVSDTYIKATVPPGATTGYVTVTTPTGVLKSNVPFHVIP